MGKLLLICIRLAISMRNSLSRRTSNLFLASNGGQLLKQAAWMPEEGYKAGVEAYRFDNDYDNAPDYKWMRQAIQINQRVFNEWKESKGKNK